MAAKRKDADSERRDRLAAIEKVAGRFKGFKPASEVLTKVRAVETIFPQVNVAIRVGGWPIERVGLIHGPSAQGKTSLTLGLCRSFLERGHFAAFVDAEFSTPAPWIETLLGIQAQSPGFRALRPDSFEQTRDEVRQFCETIGEAKDKGEISRDTSAIIVIDSIRKLFPKRMIESLEKDAEKVGVDGLKGLAGAYKASLNAAFLDETTPLLYHTGTAMAIITRERRRMNPMPFQSPWEVGGGESLLYESSLACRMTREFVKEGDTVTGERIQCRIYKSKVSGKDGGKYVDAYFHTNAQGFDPARDLLEMALNTGLVQKKSGRHWVTQSVGDLGEGEEFGTSEAESLKWLRANTTTMQAIETAVSGTYTPPEGDE